MVIAFEKTPKVAEARYEILQTPEDFLCIVIMYLIARLILKQRERNIMFKNTKLSAKLISGFGIVLVLFAIAVWVNTTTPICSGHRDGVKTGDYCY